MWSRDGRAPTSSMAMSGTMERKKISRFQRVWLELGARCTSTIHQHGKSQADGENVQHGRKRRRGRTVDWYTKETALVHRQHIRRQHQTHHWDHHLAARENKPDQHRCKTRACKSPTGPNHVEPTMDRRSKIWRSTTNQTKPNKIPPDQPTNQPMPSARWLERVLQEPRADEQ